MIASAPVELAAIRYDTIRADPIQSDMSRCDPISTGAMSETIG